MPQTQTKGTAVAAKYTLDTPLQEIVANPAARAVVEAAIPGLTTGFFYPRIKSKSIRALTLDDKDPETQKKMAALAADLAKIR